MNGRNGQNEKSFRITYSSVFIVKTRCIHDIFSVFDFSTLIVHNMGYFEHDLTVLRKCLCFTQIIPVLYTSYTTTHVTA